MTTLEKLNKIANELFEVNYVNLSKPQEIEVFAHFLSKYAVSVQPKSRSYERYSQLLDK
jgi:hypothetical protein